MTIDRFFGDYRFLSNFWLYPVMFEGEQYPSNEHAYVAAKTEDQAIRAELRRPENASPSKVKRMGRMLVLRSGWDDMRIPVMSSLIEQKFTETNELGQKLVATYPRDLIEGNSWGDTFWGVCNGVGHNHLGKLLMDRRFELKFMDML